VERARTASAMEMRSSSSFFIFFFFFSLQNIFCHSLLRTRCFYPTTTTPTVIDATVTDRRPESGD
jgi:hypothetical protein